MSGSESDGQQQIRITVHFMVPASSQWISSILEDSFHWCSEADWNEILDIWTLNWIACHRNARLFSLHLTWWLCVPIPFLSLQSRAGFFGTSSEYAYCVTLTETLLYWFVEEVSHLPFFLTVVWSETWSPLTPLPAIVCLRFSKIVDHSLFIW